MRHDDLGPAGTSRRRAGVGAGAVAIGTLVANILGYALFLVLNRQLEPDTLGAVASLLNLVIIASVAALSTQLVGAWRVANRRPQAHATVLRTGAAVGALIAGAVALLTPALVPLLHLDGPVPVLLVAATMAPAIMTAAVQGVLQGDRRFVALAVSYVAAAAGRTAGGVTAAWLGWGVDGVMGLTALASWVTTAAILLLVRDHVGSALAAGVPVHTRRVLTGMTGTSALLVASTIDIPVARNALSGSESGTYAVLGLFTKAAFWGPTFLATVLYPGMTRTKGMRPLLLALAGTTGIVAAGIALAAVLAEPLVRLAGGAAYADEGSLVPVFTALGGAWALAQVLVYWGAAKGTYAVGYLVWVAAGVATLVVTTWRSGSVLEVSTTFLLAAGTVVVIGSVLSVHRALSAQRRARTGPTPR